jgi:hypothetical protein
MLTSFNLFKSSSDLRPSVDSKDFILDDRAP